jgi:hypothetical protein
MMPWYYPACGQLPLVAGLSLISFIEIPISPPQKGGAFSFSGAPRENCQDIRKGK